jgi:hypothetical protein
VGLGAGLVDGVACGEGGGLGLGFFGEGGRGGKGIGKAERGKQKAEKGEQKEGPRDALQTRSGEKQKAEKERDKGRPGGDVSQGTSLRTPKAGGVKKAPHLGYQVRVSETKAL